MVTQKQTSIATRWRNYQPTKTAVAWMCAATAAVTIVIGFGWGGWVTGGTAEARVSSASAASRAELAALICVDRFNAEPDSRARLAELNELSSFKKREFIDQGGWAQMPGEVSATRRATDRCVDALST